MPLSSVLLHQLYLHLNRVALTLLRYLPVFLLVSLSIDYKVVKSGNEYTVLSGQKNVSSVSGGKRENNPLLKSI